MPSLVAAVVAVVTGGLVWLTLIAGDDQELRTESTAASSTAISTATTTIVPETALRFDPRNSGDVFTLLLSDGGLGAGFASSLEEPAGLPDDARAAVPDGRGGIVYVTGNEVWWLGRPSADPIIIEDPGRPVDLVGLRYTEGEPTVLVLIGNQLFGYDGGNTRFVYVFDQFSGQIGDLAVDGDIAVAVIPAGDGAATVELVSLSTGEHRRLIAAADVEEGNAPSAVAVSDGRVVVLRRQSPALILMTDGTEVGSVRVRFDAEDIFSMDLAGDRLLIAFDEAVLAIDIVGGERKVVSSPDGWARGAVWADPYVGSEPPSIQDVRRFRVDTEKVEADVSDPYLNVRLGPGTENNIVAKLASTYSGLKWTGEQKTTSEGGVWYEVELLDPVNVTSLEPLHGGRPGGWVNSALLVPLPEGLPATVADVPPCTDTGNTIVPGAGSRPAGHVYALESGYLSSRCLRIVLTFGTGTAPVSMEQATDGLAPANTLPRVFEHMSGGSGVVIDLGGIESVWAGATETADGVYVVRRADGTLQLWSPIPVTRSTVTGLAERGIVVIDLLVDSDRQVPAAGSGIVLTQTPRHGVGSVETVGIARPFEANLEVGIENDQGKPVEANFSGSLVFGTVRATEYAVQTVDWTEAWAPFAVRVEGLAPGDYTMVLNAHSGADNPQTLWVPFSITEPGHEPTLADSDDLDSVRSLVAFARGNVSLASVPLADQVTLGLGLAEARTLAKAELADPVAWTSDLDEFDGFVGGFSPLDMLARSGAVRITSGPIDHCAGPPRQWPATFDGLRQVNIEPIGIDSCIQWYAVILFLNSSDQIEAVVLDLFGP